MLATNSFIEWVAGVLVSGEGGGVKRPEREPDHPPWSSAEVENEWMDIYFYCSVCFHGSYRDISTIYLLYIYLSVLKIILKHTLFRKRDAMLLCRVWSVFWVSGGTQDACGAGSLLWIIIVLFIYHSGLKINESFGHLLGPLGETTIARRDSDQQREAVMYSSPKWVSDPESLSVWEVLD